MKLKETIEFLRDRPEVIPAIALLHQLELKLGDRSNSYATTRA